MWKLHMVDFWYLMTHTQSPVSSSCSAEPLFLHAPAFNAPPLSATKSEIIPGCDAGNVIKYFHQFFKDIRLPLTMVSPTGEDNEGIICVAAHHRSSGFTRHIDIQNFATQEWTKRGILEFLKMDGTANPADAMSKVLYIILFVRHFDRVQGYNRSMHATNLVFRPNPTQTITPTTVDCFPVHNSSPQHHITHIYIPFCIFQNARYSSIFSLNTRQHLSG
jgi:hypothetical protein